MKQFISIVCIVLMLTVLLVGCRRNNNVSDNTDGMITESTRPTSVAPTTERATTSATTESTSASVGGSENGGASGNGGASENGGMSENGTDEGSMEGRSRRGMMGNELF